MLEADVVSSAYRLFYIKNKRENIYFRHQNIFYGNMTAIVKLPSGILHTYL